MVVTTPASPNDPLYALALILFVMLSFVLIGIATTYAIRIRRRLSPALDPERNSPWVQFDREHGKAAAAVQSPPAALVRDKQPPIGLGIITPAEQLRGNAGLC